MIYLGIDVGAKGGLFAMDDSREILLKKAVPTKKGSNDVDYKAMLDMIYVLKVYAEESGEKIVGIIEDVHSLYGMSAKSNFNFGLIKGIKIGMLEALGLDYHLIKAKEWQKTVWISSDEVKTKGKRDPKLTSLQAAKRLFSRVDFRKSERARVPHDGIVDAALMAEYAYLTFN